MKAAIVYIRTRKLDKEIRTKEIVAAAPLLCDSPERSPLRCEPDAFRIARQVVSIRRIAAIVYSDKITRQKKFGQKKSSQMAQLLAEYHRGIMCEIYARALAARALD